MRRRQTCTYRSRFELAALCGHVRAAEDWASANPGLATLREKHLVAVRSRVEFHRSHSCVVPR